MARPSRKTPPTVVRKHPLPEQLNRAFHRATTDLVKLAKKAKREFDHLDTKTQRKIITGVSTIAALLTLRRTFRRRKHRG